MLINRRNGLMAGKRLPYDAEVEYLESTGTQWIDLGIKYRSSLSLGLKYSRVSQGASGSAVMSTSTTAPLVYFPALDGTNKIERFVWRRSGYSEQKYSKYFGSYPTAIYDVKFDADDDTLYINGAVAKTGIRSGMGAISSPYESSGKLTLFATSNGSFMSRARIYGAYAKDNDGGVDIIPVRFTNENGQSEGAMYDRLGVGGMNPDGSARDDGLYRNRGTGAFLMGLDKSAANGGGYKLRCTRRSYRRSWRPSARFWQPRLWKEVA